MEKDHGYVFEVLADAPSAQTPKPIKAWGRAPHEAVVIEPNRRTVYLTEDANRPTGLAYRWSAPSAATSCVRTSLTTSATHSGRQPHPGYRYLLPDRPSGHVGRRDHRSRSLAGGTVGLVRRVHRVRTADRRYVRLVGVPALVFGAASISLVALVYFGLQAALHDVLVVNPAILFVALPDASTIVTVAAGWLAGELVGVGRGELQGSPPASRSLPGEDETWAAVTASTPPGLPLGWKNFYDEDTPMLTPTQTMAHQPAPLMISYQ